jgi:ribosomal protein S18 acetylase RimI-like enzyme
MEGFLRRGVLLQPPDFGYTLIFYFRYTVMPLIRHAASSDLDALARIEAASYPPAEGADRERIKERLAAYPDCFWLEEHGGEPLGFICGMASSEEHLRDEMYENTALHTPDGAWLMLFSVVTDPEHRGEHIAVRLMEEVIRESKALGRKGIVLTCKDQYLPFYLKFGYKDEGISASEHGGVVWHEMRLTF